MTTETDVGRLEVQALSTATWPAFAALAERHNGVWGGCWDTWFHTMPHEKERTYDANRALKQRLVEEGRAHAAVVFDGDEAVGWCQYGSPAELPNINHRKEVERTTTDPPDHRITCFFVDRRYRRRGVAGVALDGAVGLVAQAGGGVVEAYPQVTSGEKLTASHLYSVTLSLFEQHGFTYLRPKGTKHCVVRRVVAPAG